MLIASHKIGSWTDPLTPPEARTECNSWATGNWPWPASGTWRTCTGWKTEFRHFEVEAFLDATGPDNIVQDAINAVGVCIVVAAATAAIAGAATDGVAVAATAQIAFTQCLEAKKVQETDKFSLSYRSGGGWTNWA